MFAHAGSHVFPFNIMLNVMMPLWKPTGPGMNRDTVVNVDRTGFEVRQINNI
jgi:hypothetical protein